MPNPKQESFSQRVLSDMSTAVLVLNRKGHIMYVNRPASEIRELSADLTPGAERFDISPENDYNDAFHEYIFEALYQKSGTHVGKVRYQSPSGRKYVFRMSSSYLGEPGAEDSEIVITFSDQTTEEVLQEKIHDSTTTFSAFRFCFSVWMILYALWEFLGRPIAADFLTHGIEVVALGMLMYILRETSLTWRDLGIHAQQPGRTVRTALIAAGCSFVFLCALKAGIRIFSPDAFEPEAPFFDISRFGLRQILYIFTAGIQEFLARSVIQGNLRRIIVSRHAGAAAIILSSLMFAAMHVHLGFLFMVGAAILAGLEGILYEKQKTILGVWIVHWVFGVSGTLLCLIDH